MAKRKTKPAIKRTDTDRLRMLGFLSFRGEKIYSRKDLADELGISTRTLYRALNVPGYRLSEKTLEKIHAPLVKLERKERRHLVRQYGMPVVPVMQFPREHRYEEKPGARSLTFDTGHMARGEIVSLLAAFKRSGEYYSWHLRVKLPAGAVYVVGEGYIFLGDEEEDMAPGQSEFFSTDPRDFDSMGRIMGEVDRYSANGMSIVNVYVYQQSFAERAEEKKRRRQFRRGKK